MIHNTLNIQENDSFSILMKNPGILKLDTFQDIQYYYLKDTD